MKLIKIIISVIVVIIFLVCIGLFIFIQTFDINRYKPTITSKLSELLGRQVQIGDLGLAMNPTEGVIVTVRDIRVVDSPKFSSDAMLEVQAIKAGVDVATFLASRELLITNIQIDAPKLRVIRNAEGILNVQTIAGQQPESKESAAAATPTPTTSAPASASGSSRSPENNLPSTPLPVIRTFRINGASVDFEDRSLKPALKIVVRDIDLSAQNVRLTKPFPFSLNLALLSSKQNASVRGEARVLPENNEFRFDDVNGQIRLDTINAAALSQIGGGIPANLPPLNGQLDMTISQMVVGKTGLLLLALEGRLAGAKIPEGLSPWPVDNLTVAFAVSESDADIKLLEATVGQGRVSASGRIDDYLHQQKMKIKLSAQNIAMLPVVRQVQKDVTFDGLLQTEIDVRFSGLAYPALLSGLEGAGRIEITQGKLKDFNILAMIFKRMSLIPNLYERINAGLPDKYREVLNRNDTLFQTFRIDVTADKGTVHLTNAEIAADAFLVKANGEFSFPQNVSLAGQVSVADDLSASIVTSVSELRTLLDDDGRLTIPLRRYEGPVDRLTIFPDLEQLGRRVILNSGKEQLQKLLDKVIDHGENASEGIPPVEGTPQEKNNGEKIIENVLDSILGGNK